jgi:hypothetical protein
MNFKKPAIHSGHQGKELFNQQLFHVKAPTDRQMRFHHLHLA